MRHGGWFPLNGDGLDLDHGKLLAMAALLLVTFALLLLEYDDFVTAFILKDLGRDNRSGEGWTADFVVSAFTGSQDFFDLDDLSGLGVRVTVDEKDVALGDSELLALGLDGGFHK